MKEQAKRLIGPRATVRLRSLIRGFERPPISAAELAHRMAFAWAR